MSPAIKTSPPSKIWLTELAIDFLKEYKGEIAETKNSVAITQLIKIGTRVDSDGRYGLRLKANNVTIDKLRQFGVRIDKDLDRQVRSHGGKLDLNLSQAYFDVICSGLAYYYFKKLSGDVVSPAELGSILVIDDILQGQPSDNVDSSRTAA